MGSQRYENIAKKIRMDNAVADALILSGEFQHVEVNENGITVTLDNFTVIYQATVAKYEEE